MSLKKLLRENFEFLQSMSVPEYSLENMQKESRDDIKELLGKTK